MKIGHRWGQPGRWIIVSASAPPSAREPRHPSSRRRAARGRGDEVGPGQDGRHQLLCANKFFEPPQVTLSAKAGARAGWMLDELRPSRRGVRPPQATLAGGRRPARAVRW